MRLAPLLLLVSAFARAQTVPSLGRTGPSLPITESLEALRARLGGPGGLFAAAQLALKEPEGGRILAESKTDPSRVRRLDVAYGLGLRDDAPSLLALASMLGDEDESVKTQAGIGVEHAGSRALPALRWTSQRGGLPAADAAAAYLPDPEKERIARDPGAAGRAGALLTLYGYEYSPDPRIVPIALAALDDPRAPVRRQAVRRIAFAARGAPRAAALRRLLRWPDAKVRAALATVVGETGGDDLGLLPALASDGDADVRLVAARSIVDGLSNGLTPSRALPALARLVDDRVPAVAEETIGRLSVLVQNEIGSVDKLSWSGLPTSAATALRRGLIRNVHGPKGFDAAVVLATAGDPRAYPFLAPVAFGGGGGGGDRTLALLAVGHSRSREATPRLVALAGDPAYGGAAIRALGLGHDPAAVAPLVRFVRNDPLNRGLSAVWALAEIGDRSATPPLIEVVRRLPRGWDANYYEPLARLGGPGVGELLLDGLANGLETTLETTGRALISLADPATIPELERIAPGSGRRSEEAKRVLAALRRRFPKRA